MSASQRQAAVERIRRGIEDRRVHPCRKIGYATEAAADGAIKVLHDKQAVAELKRPRVEARSYPCHRCGEWHLTSQTRPEKT